MKTRPTRLSDLRRVLALVSLCVASAGQVTGAERVTPLITTNRVVVTNVVLVTVTNYVVTTNLVVSTNVPAADAKRKRKKPPTPVKLPDLDWVPPADNFDWIQLKSGEWLKGRFKGMQDEELDFESEELDNLSFNWEDIRQVRSPRTIDVLFINEEEVSGPVSVTPTYVSVGGETPRVFARNDLQSLTPGGSRERNYWSGNLTAGLTLRSGNTKQVEYNAQAHLERRTPTTRLSVDYLGNISSVDDTATANDHRITAEFDLWLSQRFYMVVPYAEYYRDPFQNLAHRVTVGVGVGYDLIDRQKVEWTITAGPAYQYSWFDSAQPGEPTEKGAAALTFGSRFDWEITRKADLIMGYRGQYTSREVGETTHHAVATLSLDITKRFDLDVSFVWDRITNPKVGSDGVQPQPDDFRLIVGLGVDF